MLNHIFWFNSANCKATEEMANKFVIIKSAENEADFNNALWGKPWILFLEVP